MANLYVRSTDGSNSDNGSTWALAKATIAGASAIDAAGDVVYVSDNHAESGASASHAFAGTNANPVRVIVGDDAAEPPTAVATSATLTVSGTTFSWQGAVYTYGLSFIASSGSSFGWSFNDTTGFNQTFQSCNFQLDGSGTGSSLSFGAAGIGAANETTLLNCGVRLGATGQRFAIARATTIRGGAWLSGGTSPTGIFSLASGFRPSLLTVESFDFSALSSSVNLVQLVNEGGARAIFRNCKLPASWSGSLVASGQVSVGTRVEMHNCDATDTNYRLWVESYEGSIRSETTIVRTGGASDGTTGLSWRMVSSANVAYPNDALTSPEIVRWNDTTGSSITVTVEVVTDNVTLTDAECWLEVQYLGTSGFPLGVIARDVKTDVLASAANQASSSVTWTTTGLTTPTKQALSVSFTPQEAGFIQATVKLAKASTTVYVCPKLDVT